MEHAGQAGPLHRDQVAPWQNRPQQANSGASELRSRQPAVETFQCDVEELLEASLRRELVKALEQQEICETLLE